MIGPILVSGISLSVFLGLMPVVPDVYGHFVLCALCNPCALQVAL